MTTASDRLTRAFPWLFDHLDADDVAAFAARLGRRSFAADEALVTYGTVSDTLFFLPEGGVRVSLGRAGHALGLDDEEGLRLVGDLGVMRPGPASATVAARRPTEAFLLTHAQLVASIEEADSPVTARLLLRLAQRIALRVRQGSRVSFEEGPGGQGHLHSAFAPVDDQMGRIPTQLATMPHKGAGFGGKAPRVAEARLRAMLRAEAELAALGDPMLDALVRTVEIRTCEPGTVLMEQGTRADGAYYLLDGEARVHSSGEDGADFAVDKAVGPGHLLGQIAFVLDGERTAHVTVSQRSTVAVFYSAAVAWLVDGGAAGARAGAHFLHWIAAELADDARELNARLLGAWDARA